MRGVSVNDQMKSYTGPQSSLQSPHAMPLMMYPNDDRRSYLLTVIAYASSGLGFLASILAICLTWLLPPFKPSMPDFQKGNHHPSNRISASSEITSLPSSRPNRLRPMLIKVPSSPVGPPVGRHVSFSLISSQIDESRSRPSFQPTPLYQQEFSIPTSASVVNDLPPSVVSNRPHGDENRDSHSSHHPTHVKSNSLSTQLPILKNCPVNHQRRSSAPGSTHAGQVNTLSDVSTLPQSPTETPKSSRKFSTPGSSSSRANGIQSPLPAPSPTPSPTSSDSSKRTPTRSSFVRRLSNPRSSSPSLFRRKSGRQSSPKPALRTQPYGAPYYAPTPISVPTPGSKDPMYSSYLRRLPQFEDDIPPPMASARDEYTGESSESLGSMDGNEHIHLGPPTQKSQS